MLSNRFPLAKNRLVTFSVNDEMEIRSALLIGTSQSDVEEELIGRPRPLPPYYSPTYSAASVVIKKRTSAKNQIAFEHFNYPSN